MDWISVKDDLPNGKDSDGDFQFYIEVLVWDGSEVTTTGFRHGRWLTHWLGFDTKGVTHWMPLPEPPKGE